MNLPYWVILHYYYYYFRPVIQPPVLWSLVKTKPAHLPLDCGSSTFDLLHFMEEYIHKDVNVGRMSLSRFFTSPKLFYVWIRLFEMFENPATTFW